MQHLFVSYSPALGGAERILLDLAEGLDSPPGLLCPPGPLSEAAAAAGLRVRPLRTRRLELRGSAADRAGAPLRLAAQAREVRGAVRELSPRILVAWSMRGLFVCSAALAGVRPRPRLVFQHNDLLPGPAVGATVRAAARRADRVACLSRAIAEDLDPRGALAGRLEVVHPGVDLQRFTASGPPAEGDPEALLLGAIEPWKRPELALEIVAAATRRLPGLRLTVAGAPLGEAGERLLAGLRGRAERDDLRGRIRFAGGLEDPRPALAQASCLLHCADREPFGVALIKALAGGRPVVAPASAGPLEIVDESCGELYPPGDARAGAEALARVLSDPEHAARMGAAGRDRAEALFSLERFRELYGELLAAAGG